MFSQITRTASAALLSLLLTTVMVDAAIGPIGAASPLAAQAAADAPASA
jgi:hypothetical protein